MADYIVVRTPFHLKSELTARRKAVPRGAVGFDTETWGLSPRKHPIRTIQLGFRNFPVLVILAEQFTRDSLVELLRPIFESTDYLIIGQNLKFDYGMMWHQYGIGMPRLFDTMLAEALLTAGTYQECDLATIAEKYIDVHLDKTVRLDFTTEAVMRPDMLEYAAHDVQFLEGIMLRQCAALKDKGLLKVAALEFELLPWLARAEVAGIRINRERWLSHVATLAAERDRLQAELEERLQEYVDIYRTQQTGIKTDKRDSKLREWEAAVKDWEAMRVAFVGGYVDEALAAGQDAKLAAKNANESYRAKHKRPSKPGKVTQNSGPVNLNGPQLAGSLLALGIPLPKNEKGNPDTSKGTLNLLALDYPILEVVLEYRGVEKMVSSFGENIVALCDADGFLHPTYRQLVSTGRMACKEPNVQQIPAGTRGEEFRHSFEAQEGWLLYGGDYPQIELRILAEIAGERNMLQSFELGLDLHSLTAFKMFPEVRKTVGVDLDTFEAMGLAEQTAVLELVAAKCKDERKGAKAINFGIAYGLSPFGLARQLNITIDEAKAYIDAYFEANPKVRAWLDAQAARAKERGYSETLFGRKRFFRMPRVPRWEPPYGCDIDEYKQEYREKKKDYNRRVRMIERQACNHPIQGSSADITKRAVVLVSKRLAELGIRGGVRLVVHDEIVVVAPATDKELVERLLADSMMEAAQEFLHVVGVPVTASGDTYWNH